eukprot:jgi/Orpsp1_1/1187095/evm.model.d7180000055344.1
MENKIEEFNYLYEFIKVEGIYEIIENDSRLRNNFRTFSDEDIILCLYLIAIDDKDSDSFNKIKEYSEKHNSSIHNDIIYNIYKRELLTDDRIRKIKNICIKGNKVPFKISSDLLIAIIEKKDIRLLKLILDNFIFNNNEFIISVLNIYKNKKKYSKKKWKELISNEINKIGINQLNTSKEYSPLTFACEKGYQDIVEILIKYGANVDTEDKKGDTPLIIACKNNYNNIVKILIKNGANINKINKNGYIQPINISQKYDINYKNYMLGKFVSKTFEYEDNSKFKNEKGWGYSPLIIACEKGYQDIVRILIENGVDVNKENNNEDTPLIIACEHGNQDIVRILIDNKADVNKENKNGDTPLIIACEKSNQDIVRILIDNEADVNKENKNRDTPLIIACKKGNQDIVRTLIDNEADVNKENKNGDTPLIIACEKGNQGIVRILIDNKADVNKENKNGDIPLIVAFKKGHKDIMDIIYGKSNEESIKKWIKYCLFLGISNNAIELVQSFIKFSNENNIILNLNVKDKEGKYPLYLAYEKKSIEMAQLLLNYANENNIILNLNEKDKEGKYPLYLAFENNNIEMAKLLLNYANENNIILSIDIVYKYVYIDDYKYDEPLDYPINIACKNDNTEMVKLMIDYVNENNIKLELPIIHKEHPLKYSFENNNITISRLLLNYINENSIKLELNIFYPLLLSACVNNNYELVKLLIEYSNKNDIKLELNRKNDKNEYPFLFILKNNNIEIAQLLIDYANNNNIKLDLYGFDMKNISKNLNDLLKNNENIINKNKRDENELFDILVDIINNNEDNKIDKFKSILDEANENGIKLDLNKKYFEGYNIEDEYGDFTEYFLLYNACCSNNTEIVKLLMEYANKNNIKLNLNDSICDCYDEYFGPNPLHQAIENHNIEIVKLLINYAKENEIKLDLEKDNDDDPNPIILSSCKSKNIEENHENEITLKKFIVTNKRSFFYDSEIPKLLLRYANEEKIKLDLNNKLWEKGQNQENLFSLLSWSKTNDYLLSIACKINDNEMMQLLIENAEQNNYILELNEVDSSGKYYPLLYVYENKNIEAVKLLIKYAFKNEIPIKLNKELMDMDDLLLLACEKNDFEAIELLKKYAPIIKISLEKTEETEFSEKDNFKNYLLLLACKKNNDSAVNVLIEHNVDIFKEDKDGYTPLHYVLKTNNKNIINIFTDHINYLYPSIKSLHSILKEQYIYKLKSEIEDNYQYKVNSENYLEWKIPNLEYFENNFKCCSPYFKIGDLIMKIELEKKEDSNLNIKIIIVNNILNAFVDIAFSIINANYYLLEKINASSFELNNQNQSFEFEKSRDINNFQNETGPLKIGIYFKQYHTNDN